MLLVVVRILLPIKRLDSLGVADSTDAIFFGLGSYVIQHCSLIGQYSNSNNNGLLSSSDAQSVPGAHCSFR